MTEEKIIKDLLSLKDGIYRLQGEVRTDRKARFHESFYNWYAKTFNGAPAKPLRKKSIGFVEVLRKNGDEVNFMFRDSYNSHWPLSGPKAFVIIFTKEKYSHFMELALQHFLMKWALNNPHYNYEMERERGLSNIMMMHRNLSYLFNK